MVNFDIKIHYLLNSPVISWVPYPKAISYNIYRGTSKENLDLITNEGKVLMFNDTDVKVNIIEKENRTIIFYDVEAVLEDGTTYRYNKPTFYTPIIEYPYYGVIQTIIKRHELMLKIGAETCIIYNKKTFGKVCSKCWNTIINNSESAEPLCDVCYNTGFIGGYNKFVTKLMIRDAPDAYVETPFGIQKQSAGKQGWVSGYPFIFAGDMIVEPNGDRWIIDSVKVKEFKNIITLQIANITYLQSTHPLYQINL